VIERYMADLEAALCVRGRTRKRFLSECHDHLIDLANDVGPDDAAVAFGAPGTVAASFDAEVATSRCARAAWLAAVGIASVAGSTLVLIHSADATAQAAVPWAIAFFVCAQVSAVAMVIGLIQAMSIRHRVVPPADSMLLCRRTAIALVSAAGTMLAAGGALPGRGDPLVLLAGPALAIVAGGVLSRAWWLTRQLEGAHSHADRSPFADLRSLTRLPVPTLGPIAVATIGAAAVFVRDRGEQGTTLGGSLLVGAIEAGLVVAAYLALRAPLGLRTGTTATD